MWDQVVFGKTEEIDAVGGVSERFCSVRGNQTNRAIIAKIDQNASENVQSPKNVNNGTEKPAATAAPRVKEVA